MTVNDDDLDGDDSFDEGDESVYFSEVPLSEEQEAQLPLIQKPHYDTDDELQPGSESATLWDIALEENSPSLENLTMEKCKKDFFALVEQLDAITKKAFALPQYQEAAKSAHALNKELTAAGLTFFQSPGKASKFSTFQGECRQAIEKAELEFKKHTSIWSSISMVLKGIIGVIVGIATLPLMPAPKYRDAYKNMFFSQKDDTAKGLSSIKEKLGAMKETLTDQTEEKDNEEETDRKFHYTPSPKG